MTAAPARTDALIAELRARFDNRLSTVASVREQHGRDESYHRTMPPDAVVFAQSTEDVRDIVLICRKHNAPIIPFGSGTSLEGQVAALKGGVCIDLSQMNRVVAVNAQ